MRQTSQSVFKPLAVGAAVLLSVLSLAACGGDNDEEAPAAAAATGPMSAVEPVAERTEVKLAITGSQVLTLPLWLAVDKGYFDQVGLDVELEPYRGSTNELLPSLATGRLDIAPGTPSPAIYNQLEEGFDIRAIASLGEEKPDRIQSAWLTVLNDQADAFADLPDLAGKRVEGAREGSPPAMLVNQALDAAGLTPGDVELTYRVQQPPDMLAIARAGGADVIGMSEPLATQAEQQGVVKKWKGVSDIMPWFQAGLLVASPAFLKDKPEAAAKFLAAYLVACREINATNGEWTPELVEVVQKNFDISPDDIRAQGGVPYFNPAGEISAESLDRIQQMYVDDGVLKNPVELTELTDTTPLDAAVAEVGK